jgi:hypothetical protein
MRLILLPLFAAALAAPALPSASASDRERCADRLTQVRDAAGQPRLDRSPAAPGEGYLIAAVDKRIDGCAVMQMHRRIDDLRPVPEPRLGPVRLEPAR